MVFPLGRTTEIGDEATSLLVYGAVVVRKWPVQPVSRITGAGKDAVLGERR